MRQARSVLLGGCLLVCLSLMAYYGAFEDLHYQTFTTAIFGELQTQFNPAGASALSLVLVILSILVLGGETTFRERGRLQRSGAMAQRAQQPIPLGRARAARPGRGRPPGGACPRLPGRDRLLLDDHRRRRRLFPPRSRWALPPGTPPCTAPWGRWSRRSSRFPVSLLAVRHQRRWSTALERSTFITQAIPGVVIGLALVFLASRYLGFLYQSPELLVASYTLMFFPLGLVAVTSSVLRASPRLEEAGRSLGRRPWAVRLTVTLPLLAPGLAAAFCFVFLSAATELTATLLLVPTGVQTLATQFWAYAEQGVSFGAAAPYAAAMILMSAVPAYLLGPLVRP